MTPSHQPGHFYSWKSAVWKPITEEWQKLSSGFKKNLCIFKAAHKEELFCNELSESTSHRKGKHCQTEGKRNGYFVFYYYNHFGETKVGTVFQQKAQPTRKTRKYRQTVIKPLEVRNLYKLYMKNHILTSKNKVLSNAPTMKIQKYRDLLHGDL